MIASIGYIQNTIHCIQRQPHGQIWGQASRHPAEVKSQLHTRASHFQQPFATIYPFNILQLLLSVKPCKNSFQHGNQLPFFHQLSQKTTVPRHFFRGCFAVELLSCDVTAVPSLNPGLPVPAMVSLAALKAFPKRYYMGNHNILMEEIRLTSGYGEFATIYSVLYIPGACLGFLPSTVFHNQR